MRPFYTCIFGIALLASSLSAAETYKFQLKSRVLAGQAELQPGNYSIVVDGSIAVLKDKKGKTIEVKAAVQQAAQKPVETEVGMKGDPRKLSSVTPGGTTVRVVFE